jgi:DNA polymerase I-like protein with 3'-5' exonuclease and polymerase domains
MWWMMRAMQKCWLKLHEWLQERFAAYLVMQIHDEMVFDFPRGKGPRPWETNLPRVRVLQRLMESCGEDFVPSIPTPVTVEYHAEDWSKGVTV